MNASRCDQLDDYLAGWLSDADASGFEAHLADCPVCRRQLDQQGQIDRLLAKVTEQLEHVPHGLVDRIESQIRVFKRRRMVQLAVGISAVSAAVLLLLAGVWPTGEHVNAPAEPQPGAQKQDEHAVVQRDVGPPAVAATDDEPFVRVGPSDPSAAILVPVVTENPNVTIVWFHPTVRPASVLNGADTN
jgi:anti-sigma factor RsiW